MDGAGTDHRRGDDRDDDGESTVEVIVLGSHLATGLLAAALARHGVRVALVRDETDRVTPAGETTVPYTAELFFLFGARFGLPEVWDLGMFDRVPQAVRSTSGVKQSLGFLYHRSGLPHRPAEALQFNVPGEHAEWHPFRPDLDDYAERLAERYGATVPRAAARPFGVRVDRDRTVVELTDGGSLRGRLLVNGSGDDRLLPRGVAGPDPDRTRHRARLLVARPPEVRPFESVVPQRRYGRKSSPWSAGTLLHAFDGGWIQLTPFGNHPSGTARCVGVVASMDSDRDVDGRPGTELDRLVGDFPQLSQQLADLGGTEQWRRYDRWPAVVATSSGPGWFLFDRAAGRHDFLLSRDISLSLELAHALTAALLATADSPDRFDQPTGERAGELLRAAAGFQLSMFDFHDRMVAAARLASRDFATWNAFLRVWLLWSIICTMSLRRARLDGPEQRWATVALLDRAPYWYQVPEGLPELVGAAFDDFEQLAAGLPAASVARRVFERLRAAPFAPPLYAFGDPDARYYNFTRARRFQTLFWSRITAPTEFRRLFLPNNVTGTPEAPRHRN